MTDFIGIASAFMFALLLLLVAVIGSGLRWQLKALLILSSLLAVWAGHHSWVTSLGWAVPDTPSHRMQVLAFEIREPTRATAGAIWIWYIPEGREEPRAIRLPYSREMHERVQRARAAIEAGEEVHMQRPDRHGGREGREGPESAQQVPLDFIPPPQTLPRKQ